MLYTAPIKCACCCVARLARSQQCMCHPQIIILCTYIELCLLLLNARLLTLWQTFSLCLFFIQNKAVSVVIWKKPCIAFKSIDRPDAKRQNNRRPCIPKLIGNEMATNSITEYKMSGMLTIFPALKSMWSPWGPILIKDRQSGRFRVDLELQRELLHLVVPLKPQEILFHKAPLWFSGLGSLWRQGASGFKQGVCLWKSRSAFHFQSRWRQSPPASVDLSHNLIFSAAHHLPPSAYFHRNHIVYITGLSLNTLQSAMLLWLFSSGFLALKWPEAGTFCKD